MTFAVRSRRKVAARTRGAARDADEARKNPPAVPSVIFRNFAPRLSRSGSNQVVRRGHCAPSHPGSHHPSARRLAVVRGNKPLRDRSMAAEFYALVDRRGVKQGKFKGETIREAHKEKITGLSCSHEITSSPDVATGRARCSRRQHGPVIITKEWGPATPRIFQAS